jgi:PKD repeat protein
MTMKLKILTPLLVLLALSARPDNAPVTTAGAITNATTGPGAVTVPITVSNFVSIGAFTLTLRYRHNLAQYVSATPNPAFPGMTVTPSVEGSIGKLIITWPETAGGVTLPDGAHLLDLTFTYLSGTTTMAWSYNTPFVCEYKKFTGGGFVVLDDSPEASYYINGGISNRSAPVTTASTIANPTPGSQVNVPVTVTGFTTIGSYYLQLEYDSTVMTYVSVTPNSIFIGAFSSGVAPGSGKKKILTVGWYGSSVTLANGSTLYTVRFTYNNTAGKGNYSTLSFFDNGPSCEFADNNGYVLIDFPYADYYKTGLIYSQFAARTWLPQITGAAANSPLSLPVKTTGFSSISSFNLSFEYDSTAMSYNSFTANAAFGGAVTVTSSPAAGTKKKLTINWPGTAPLTLPDTSTLVTLDVTHLAGTTALAWVTGDATSCRFNDAVGNAYYDLPKSTYYTDGLVGGQVAPLTVALSASPTVGQQVTIPVLVHQFLVIGSWSLALDYDPGVLTYVSASLAPAIGGTYSAGLQGAGRISMTWTGAATSLPDSTTLVNLTFTYNGGETPLVWYDNGSSCRYAASPTSPDLYDQPKTQYYINGYVGPNSVVANFMANNLLPLVNQPVNFTDQSTGSPTGWLWIFSPPSVSYLNGTGPTSQNPQVQFTVNGVYTITLLVTKGFATGVKTRSEYIHVGTPGLWTGITSTDWNVASNWHKYLVPENTMDVTVPTSAPYWPHLAGDLTLGASPCQDLTLQGNAQLAIDGDLTINGGRSLIFTGAGLLSLGGNWSNSGTFTCGTGTIDFTGTEDAVISVINPPETFYKIIVSKPGGKVSVTGNVQVVGQ